MIGNPFLCFAISLILSSIFMAFLWAIQGKWVKASSVDFFWSLGVGAHGLFFCFYGDGDPTRRVLVSILIAFWSLRLCVLVFVRLLFLPEDGRYFELASESQETRTLRMFGFFQVQAFAVSLFGMVCWLPAQNGSPVGFFDYAALLIGVLAVSLEILSDWQLTRFRFHPTNSGQVCQSGLWYYSRHPNYFFETVHWWAYVLFTIGTGWFWINAVFPLLMTFFIFYFTGIPSTERQALRSRGEAYRDYQKTTSVFVPWFKKTLPQK